MSDVRPKKTLNARPFHACACGDHSFVQLTRGFVALVDPTDAELLSGRNWTALYNPGRQSAYAYRRPDSGSVMMHRVVARTEQTVDHINRNGLDNRKRNLRICCHDENVRNAPARKSSASRFKGVHWKARDKKWYAEIQIDGRKIFLGSFHDEAAAARAYDAAAIKHHGDFAFLNFPYAKSRGIE